MNFSKKLKEQRTIHKLSQEQLADKLHIARQSISKWERGESYPSIDALLRLSDLFDITIDELLKDDSRLKEDVIKSSQKPKHPKLILLFDWIFITGLLLLLSRLVIGALAHFDITDWEVDFLRGWLPSLIPLSLMLIGGAVADDLRKNIKQ